MNERTFAGSAGTKAERHISRDLCRDLLHGLLSAVEQDQVLQHVAGCPPCEKLLQEMVAERERLRAVQTTWLDESEQPGGSLGEILSHLTGRLAAAFWQPQYRYATALVAVAAVLLLILWPHPDQGPDGLAVQWLPAAGNEVRLRDGAQSIADQDLASGLAAYAARDLKSAITRLERAELSGQLETIRRIYLSNALAIRGEYDKAVELLRTMGVDPLPDPWRSETLWTLYVALRATGRDASADSLLQCLVREPLEIGERARRELQARQR